MALPLALPLLPWSMSELMAERKGEGNQQEMQEPIHSAGFDQAERSAVPLPKTPLFTP